MLLMQLALLILGVLCPYEIRLGYFTHILIFCLYLLATKNYKHLIFITILLISLLLTWGQQDTDLRLNLMDEYSISFADVTRHSEFGYMLDVSALLKRESTWYQVFRFNRQRFVVKFAFNESYQQIEPVNNAFNNSSNVSLKLTSIEAADINGNWLQRRLYRNGLSGELHFQVLNWSEEQKREFEDIKPTLRVSLLNKLDDLYESLKSWPYIKALLFGDTQALSQKQRWSIKYFGLMHLFVVSGLHIGFIYLIGSTISRLSWQILPSFLIGFFGQKLAFTLLILMPITLFYAYLTGWGESVQRAVIMLFTWQAMKLFGIKLASFYVLSISLYLILLIDPLSIYSVGLWLSFSLVYLLLIYFERDAKQTFQAIQLQVLLSLCATSLILGWQISLSSGVILINLICLPIIGIFLFPMAFLASLFDFILAEINLMIWLDELLIWVLPKLEYFLMDLPSLSLNRDLGVAIKLVLYSLCLVWVLFRHKGYVWLCFPFLISVMIFSGKLSEVGTGTYQLSNNTNIIELKSDQTNSLLSSIWVNNTSEMSMLWLGDYFDELTENERVLIWPFSNGKVSAYFLKALSPKWLVLNAPPDLKLTALMEAMNVSWLVLAEGEMIKFEFWRGQWVIKHSNCLIFLISGQENNCMRVAELESVLNYSPKH